MNTYIGYHYGKMNQSFAMKNENRESIFEANLVKYKLFGPSIFEFENKINNTKEVHKIGKTVTTEQGNGVFSFNTASYFKYDGVNVFDYLDKKGLYFKITKFHLIQPEFSLFDNANNEVAVYKMNVKGEREENVSGIGKKQFNIVINAYSEDLEIVFMAAFILSRVDFSAYLV